MTRANETFAFIVAAPYDGPAANALTRFTGRYTYREHQWIAAGSAALERFALAEPARPALATLTGEHCTDHEQHRRQWPAGEQVNEKRWLLGAERAEMRGDVLEGDHRSHHHEDLTGANHDPFAAILSPFELQRGRRLLRLGMR